MVERTDEEKVFQEPIKVMLGGREYDISPLVIKYSRPWRKKVISLISTLPKYAKANTNNPDEFAEAINALMVESQDTIIDLFFEYARDLNRDEIEELATETDIAVAFQVVMNLAFPLSETLPSMMGPEEKKKKSPSQKG